MLMVSLLQSTISITQQLQSSKMTICLLLTQLLILQHTSNVVTHAASTPISSLLLTTLLLPSGLTPPSPNPDAATAANLDAVFVLDASDDLGGWTLQTQLAASLGSNFSSGAGARMAVVHMGKGVSGSTAGYLVLLNTCCT